MNSGAQSKGYDRLTHQVTDPRTTVMLIGRELRNDKYGVVNLHLKEKWSIPACRWRLLLVGASTGGSCQWTGNSGDSEDSNER